MEKVNIGKIIGTHGLRGELRVYPTTDFIDERFSKGSQLYIDFNHQEINVEVKSFRFHKGVILVLFKGLEDINLVEQYKQCVLKADVDYDLLDDGEFFYVDIIGCKVIDQRHGEIGVIDSIMETPAHDILVIKTSNGEIKVPYVDAFVLEEDIDNKIFHVSLLEGMYNED